MVQNVIEQSVISIIMGLAVSIGLHDTHLDRATMVAVTPPSLNQMLAQTAKISVHFHTHVERTSLGEVSSMENANPHRHARFRERKHMKNKYHLKGGRLAPLTRPV